MFFSMPGRLIHKVLHSSRGQVARTVALTALWAVQASQAFEVMPVPADAPPIVIDGRLDDPAWRSAAVHDRFTQLDPRAGGPVSPALRTQVQVLVDGRALIVGVRAWAAAPPQVVLSRRDAVQRDQDMVGLWIDTGGRGESALFVKASLAGVVTDGLYRAADDEEDLGPDFPVTVATQRLPDGYSMEIRWPLSALRYPYQAAAPWRMLVARAIPAEGDLLLVSGEARAEALDLLHAAQPVQGLAPVLARHRDLQDLQATVEWTGRSVRGGGDDADRGSAGVEGWWRPRADWLVNATLNPDFAQVDVDAPQASGNQAIALALPEKRRYFLESADVLGLPLSSFYSRSIADPRWGLRATWRGAQADATALLAEDRAGTLVPRGRPWGTEDWTFAEPSVSQLVRARWQLASEGGSLTPGVMVARRAIDNDRYNQLVGTDGVWRRNAEGRHMQLQWSVVGSENTLAADGEGALRARTDAAQHGWNVWGKALYSDERWLNIVEAGAVTPDFINLLGFVDQAGLWRVQTEFNRRLGEIDALSLHQSELHFAVNEYRSLRDETRGEPGGEVIRRELRVGTWFAAPRRTNTWFKFGADQQRARSGGALHDTPALHAGGETTPWPWLARFIGEGSWGRQLDAEYDRTGRGGWWSLRANTRWPLPGDRSVELDPVFTGVRIAAEDGHPALTETGVRLLALLHLDAERSIRVILQDERSRRGATAVEPAHTDRRAHRSLMWKSRLGLRHQLAVGVQWDSQPGQDTRREAFLKWQTALGTGS
jgi:hypothetical protein